MPGVVAALIAALIGALFGIGGGFLLTSSQGGGSFPTQVEGPIVVYGTN